MNNKQFNILSTYYIKLTMTNFIGKGSYGNVFKIIQNNKTYALKQSIDIFDEITISSFLLEIIVSLSFTHPNIIKCKKYSLYNDSIEIYMEYYPMNLYSYINTIKKENKIIPINIVNKMIIDIASGLEYLHSKSILHLDISDDNILLKSDLTCVITDFGLCNVEKDCVIENSLCGNKRKFDESTQKFSVYKNPFASPEVLLKKYYDRSSDIWAFGVLIVKILSTSYIFKNTDRNVQILFIELFFNYDTESKIKFILNTIKLRKLDKYNLYKNPNDITITHLNILMLIFQENSSLRISASEIIHNVNKYEINNNIVSPIEDKMSKSKLCKIQKSINNINTYDSLNIQTYYKCIQEQNNQHFELEICN